MDKTTEKGVLMSYDRKKGTIHLERKPLFIMMVGLPHSGKTRVAGQIAKQEKRRTIIVSASVIRDTLKYTSTKNIFREARREIIDGLQQDRNVILDATNIDAGERTKTIEHIKKFTDKIICVFVDTPLPVCIANYTKLHSHSYSKIRVDGIKRKAKQLKKAENKPCQAGPQSGFDEIHHYQWNGDGKFIIHVLHPPICTYPPHKKGGKRKAIYPYPEHIAQ